MATSNSRDIRHDGRITAIDSAITTVEIISKSACSSCHAASLCGMSEQSRKLIDVPTTLGDWQIGEEVEVVLRKSMGHKAVWIAYVLPLFVMMTVLLSLIAAGLSETLAGLSAIASVAVYYLGIFLFRNALKKEYSFYIKKK